MCLARHEAAIPGTTLAVWVARKGAGAEGGLPLPVPLDLGALEMEAARWGWACGGFGDLMAELSDLGQQGVGMRQGPGSGQPACCGCTEGPWMDAAAHRRRGPLTSASWDARVRGAYENLPTPACSLFKVLEDLGIS